MKIQVNKDYTIDVNEKYLTVKDKHLYNTSTKRFEGVEGDIIMFVYTNEGGNTFNVTGAIEGYSNGKTVKLRGVEKIYELGKRYEIDHVSVVEDISEEVVITTDTIEID